MKKFISLSLITVFILIGLTGCVSVNYEVAVNKDGSADVSFVYAYTKDFLNNIGLTAENILESFQKNVVNNGYSIEKYEKDNLSGIIATKHLNNSKELSFQEIFGKEGLNQSDNSGINIEKNFFEIIYSQNAVIDLSEIKSENSSDEVLTYSVKLPTKVKNTNADNVSDNGKILTWNLSTGTNKEIKFEATQISNIFLYSIIVIIIIMALTSIIIIKKSHSKK